MPYDDLIAGARAAFGARLVGAYAVTADGSDVVVVVHGRADDVLDALGDLHARLVDGGRSPGAVSYADAADLRSPMTLGRRWPYAARGARVVAPSAHHNTAAVRWVLRERGRVLTGPAPGGLVAEVTADVLRAEALGLARAHAERVELDPSVLEDAPARVDVVLTACRVLRTAVHADVLDGRAAARWAREHLDPVHRPVVEAALDPRPGPGAAAVRALLWDVALRAGEAALRER